MEQFDVQFWIQIVIYAVSFGIVYGQLQTKIKYIEQKLDKHNNFVERLYKVEESVRLAQSRIDNLEDDR